MRAALPPLEQLETWAAGAKALADPTRLAIALALRDGERACVCDLAWIVGRDEKLVSHHVRQLKGRRASVLRARRQDGDVRADSPGPRAPDGDRRRGGAHVTPPVHLPTVHGAAGSASAGTADGGRPTAAITRDRYEQLAGRVKLLSWLSLAWMTVEGAVASSPASSPARSR